MTLYHGSNVEVLTPELLPSVRALEFDRGFYLTSDFDQAARWAGTAEFSEGRALRTAFRWMFLTTTTRKSCVA